MLPGPLEKSIVGGEGPAAELRTGVRRRDLPVRRRGVRWITSGFWISFAEPALVLLCGRYEGVDQRLIERCVDEEISLVISCFRGELPAMVLLDAMIRQLPGALNDGDSAVEDSFVDGLLDCPTTPGPWCTRRWRCPMSCCRAIMPNPALAFAAVPGAYRVASPGPAGRAKVEQGRVAPAGGFPAGRHEAGPSSFAGFIIMACIRWRPALHERPKAIFLSGATHEPHSAAGTRRNRPPDPGQDHPEFAPATPWLFR